MIPELVRGAVRPVARGTHAEALALQRRITPLAKLVTSAYGVPGLKAAMDIAGYAGGAPRRPLPPRNAAGPSRPFGPQLAALGIEAH